MLKKHRTLVTAFLLGATGLVAASANSNARTAEIEKEQTAAAPPAVVDTAAEALPASPVEKLNLEKQHYVSLLQEDSDCKEYKPVDCPKVAPCAEEDACVILKVPPIEYSRPSYTHGGTYAFSSIFSAAAARGVENAMIRAMNATKVCPSCEPGSQAAPQAAPAPADPTPPADANAT